MANTHRGGGALYGADPYRTREGLSARAAANSNEIQLRIDPTHADLDEEITGIHKQVTRLKSVAQEIESEAKFQKDLLSQLKMHVIKAEAVLKNGMRRLKWIIIQQASNNILLVVVLGLVCFSLVYLWTKYFKR